MHRSQLFHCYLQYLAASDGIPKRFLLSLPGDGPSPPSEGNKATFSSNQGGRVYVGDVQGRILFLTILYRRRSHLRVQQFLPRLSWPE